MMVEEAELLLLSFVKLFYFYLTFFDMFLPLLAFIFILTFSASTVFLSFAVLGNALLV